MALFSAQPGAPAYPHARTDFSRMFRPQSIAVVGASAEESRPSGQPLMHLRNHGYKGRVYPVNPKYQAIGDWACYPSVEALPEVPDVALIAVAADRAVEMVTACGRKGIPFAIIITSGFAEMGEAGVQAQEQLVAAARATGITIVGPNCQGMINAAHRLSLGFGAPYGLVYNKGPISMTSQSGAWGNSTMILVNAAGIGFQNYQSTGNEAATTSLDLVDWYLDDPDTRIVVSYVEGFKDAHRVIGIGRKALAVGKPYLLWKVGSSEAGARAAASHTANLGGAMALYRAAFRQSGIIEVTDADELADRARALLGGRLPRGNRVAVITTSGGAGVLMADHCAAGGLELPALQDSTLTRLRSFLPAFAGLNNPIDVTGNAGRDGFLEAIRVAAADPNIDMVGLSLAAVSGPHGIAIAEGVAQIAGEIDKPLLVAWSAADPQKTKPGYDALAAAQVARYDTPVKCARGLETLWRFARAQTECARINTEPVLVLQQPAQQSALNGRHDDLTEFEAKKVLASYGIPVTREMLAGNADEAASHARAIGFPVVMKIVSPDIPHKSEAGGVRVGVSDETEARAAFAELVSNARAFDANARIDGVLVQTMVEDGVEVILGVTNDPLFGPAIMFGLGGIFAEVMKDVSFRITPVRRSEINDMIREIKAFPILDGARGRPKADVDALADAIERLAALATDLAAQVSDVDINPLFVLPAGRGVIAADALIKLRPAPISG